MAGETIREFLVSVGWDLDQSGERRFIAAIEGATLKANLLATALEDMARTAVAAIGNVAANLEQLYYQSQRSGASVQGIKAFEFAVSQLGGTAEGAGASLENFGRFLRNNPGARNWVESLGVHTRKANGDLEDTDKILLGLGQKMSAMPAYLSNAYRESLQGVDEGTYFAIMKAGQARKFYDDSLRRQGEAGIGPEAAKQAAQFEQTWRGVWDRIGNMAEGGESKLFGALTKPMQDFSDWLDKHQPELDESIGKIAGSFDHLAEQWTLDTSKLVFGDDQIKGINDAATAVSHFLDSMAPLVSELEKFNEESKDWWFIKLLNGAGQDWGYSLPDGPGFWASHGPGVTGSDIESGTTGFFGRMWNGVKSFFGGGGDIGTGPLSKGLDPQVVEKIKAAATRQGIDPNVALRVYAAEGPGSTLDRMQSGDYGTSAGPFQLHRGGPGSVGTEYERQTGFSIFDPKHLDDYLDFTMRWVRAHGWDAWSSKTNTGIYGFTGVGPMPPAEPPKATPQTGVAPAAPSSTLQASIPSAGIPGWEAASSAWAEINAQAATAGYLATATSAAGPVVNSSVSNTINVHTNDAQSAASMVGVHLDRTAHDIARNLQGAVQ